MKHCKDCQNCEQPTDRIFVTDDDVELCEACFRECPIERHLQPVEHDPETGHWIARHSIVTAARTEEDAHTALALAVKLTAETWQPRKVWCADGSSQEPAADSRAQRQDASSVQEGVVEAIIECDQCGLKQSEWKLPLVVGASCPKHYLDDDSCDGLIHAVRQSSPRSQPVTAKEERACPSCKQRKRPANRDGDVCPECGGTGVVEPPSAQPVTSASIEEAKEQFLAWIVPKNDDARRNISDQLDALITAVRQESTS